MSLLLIVAPPSSAAAGPGADPERSVQAFVPSAALDYDALVTLVDGGVPELEAARLALELAAAERRQSRLLPNPTLDVGYGTIPVGATNPTDLARPLANVPNYGVGLSFLVELGKRGPRKRAASARERGARAELAAETRARALALAEVLGELATASLRVEGFEQVVADMQRAVEAVEARVALSFAAPLDVDRLEVELARAEALVLVARSDVASALVDCAAVLGRPCAGFVDGDAARAYLEAWIDAMAQEREQDGSALAERPDLEALGAYADAARAEERLARNQAIPDPTLRFGYLHDRFLISGNQRNSLAISLSFELPIFDRGQAQRAAARAKVKRLAAERRKRLSAAQSQLPALVERAQLERARQRALHGEAIPAARRITEELEQAVEQRLSTVAEVIQARRVLRELLLEEADAYADAYRARIALLRALAPVPASEVQP